MFAGGERQQHAVRLEVQEPPNGCQRKQFRKRRPVLVQIDPPKISQYCFTDGAQHWQLSSLRHAPMNVQLI
jgi:hypothetical protein